MRYCHCGLPIIEDDECKYCKLQACQICFGSLIYYPSLDSVIDINDLITEQDFEEAEA
jgi:hypothetical protein